MGKIVLLIAIMIETAFAIYCIRTKSSQKKTKSMLRIGMFAVFILFMLLSIIKWGFRWKALAVLLFVWAAIGVFTLLRNKADKKEYKSRRIIIKAICMVLLVLIALLPAFVFPEYKMIETTGEFKVATVLSTYVDVNRTEYYTDSGENRKLNVEFWYPEETDKTYPLIVFSHGSFGTRTSNESLYYELASHGYVVCSVDHTYQCLSTTDVEGNKTSIDMGYVKEVSAEDAKTDKQQSFEYYQKWMGIRTGDIDFVIDYILEEADNKNENSVYKLVDKEKIGVMGHSLGGAAALGIGRRRDDVSAVVALESPFMCDIEGVEDEEFIFTEELYPVPVLNIYSDSSWSNLSQWAQYEKNYELLSGTEANSFNAHIHGVGHLTLTDLALSSPFFTRVLNGHKSEADTRDCLKTINKLTLEFFNCYLKEEGKFASDGVY